MQYTVQTPHDASHGMHKWSKPSLMFRHVLWDVGGILYWISYNCNCFSTLNKFKPNNSCQTHTHTQHTMHTTMHTTTTATTKTVKDQLSAPPTALLDDLLKSILRHMISRQSSPYALYQYLTQTHPLSLVLMQSSNFHTFVSDWCQRHLPDLETLLRQYLQSPSDGDSESEGGAMTSNMMDWNAANEEQREAVRANIFRETLSMVSVLSNFFSLLSDFPLGQAARYGAANGTESDASERYRLDHLWHVRVALCGLESILGSQFIGKDVEARAGYRAVVARLHSQISALLLKLADEGGHLGGSDCGSGSGDGIGSDDAKLLFRAKSHCMEALKRIDAKQLPNEYAVNRQQIALILKKERNYVRAIDEFERVLAMRDGAGKLLTSVNLSNCLTEYAEASFNKTAPQPLDTILVPHQLWTTPVDMIVDYADIMANLDRAIVLLTDAADQFSRGKDQSKANVARLNLAQTLIRKCKIMLQMEAQDRKSVADTIQAIRESLEKLVASQSHVATKSKDEAITRIKTLEGELYYYRFLLNYDKGDSKYLLKANSTMQTVFNSIQSRAQGTQLYYKVVRHLALVNKLLSESSQENDQKNAHLQESAHFLQLAIASRKLLSKSQQTGQSSAVDDPEMEHLSKELQEMGVAE